MIWIRLFLTGLCSVGMAGSLAYACTILVPVFAKEANPYLLMLWQKLSYILYWIPIPFAVICLSRVRYENGYCHMWGEFITGTTSVINRVCMFLGILWLTGVLVSGVHAACRELKVRRMLSGNIPVDDEMLIRIFSEYQERFGLDNVELFQNDLMVSPVTYEYMEHGHRQYKIILPVAGYTEKQLHMIVTHEMNHVISHDLEWRKFGLVTALLHWFNPIVHIQLRQLVYWEEVLCDLRSCSGSSWYTRKEYACFLAELSDREIFNVSTSALRGTKNQVLRRILMMKRTRELKKPSKWMIAASCLSLVVATLVPVSLVSAKGADLQEELLVESEIGSAEENNVAAAFSAEMEMIGDGNVTEIDLTSDIMPYSDNVILDETIPAGTRVLYYYRSMSAGNSITISANCSDSSITYRIGIKNQGQNSVRYIEGTGVLNHTFEIDENGTYSAYVENCSDATMTVKGSANYFD